MTVAELQSLSPEALAAVAADLLAHGRRLTDAGDGLVAAAPPPSWLGAAGDAARARHRRLGPGLEVLQARVGTVATALDLAATSLREAQRMLGRAIAEGSVAGGLQALADAQAADRALARALSPGAPPTGSWADQRHEELTSRLRDLRRQLAEEERTTVLADLAALEQALADDPALRLLRLDASGDTLRVALAVGDVARADHVAVLVPGFGTTVADGLAAGLLDTDRLLDRAATVDEAEDGTADTFAGIWFLGYEAPSLDHDLARFAGVAGTGAARRGAQDLAALLREVDEERPDGVHLTALGHSYGSLVVGLALREPTGVDDAVVSGSPGIGTREVGELRLPAGHGWVLEADDDLVADLGWFGRDPSRMAGLQQLSADEAVHRGERLDASRGHTGYDGAGTTGLHNQAAVVAGHPEATVREGAP